MHGGLPGPRAPTRDVVVLAADPETGDVGRLTVVSLSGRVELAERHASTTIISGAAPSPPTTMSEADIQRLFGPALAVQPPPALRFLLYFELGGDTLTPESKAQLPAVLAAARGRVAPDVSVIGHTDTTGAATTNAALGLQHACSFAINSSRPASIRSSSTWFRSANPTCWCRRQTTSRKPATAGWK